MANEDTIRRDMDALKGDLTALRTDLKDLGRDMASAARTGAEAAKDRVRTMVDSAKTHGGDTAKKIQSSIEEQPMKACLIAFGAGVLLGALLKR